MSIAKWVQSWWEHRPAKGDRCSWCREQLGNVRAVVDNHQVHPGRCEVAMDEFVAERMVL